MKITFIDNKQNLNTTIIRLFLKDSLENDIQIDLKRGEFVFSETSYLTNSLRIYSKKEIIKIEHIEKPESFQYYLGYNNQSSAIVKEKELEIVDGENYASPENDNNIDEEIEIVEISLEEGDDEENPINVENNDEAENKEIDVEARKVDVEAGEIDVEMGETVDDELKTKLETVKKEVKKYKKTTSKRKKKKKIGRPKKRGPKVKSKRKKK